MFSLIWKKLNGFKWNWIEQLIGVQCDHETMNTFLHEMKKMWNLGGIYSQNFWNPKMSYKTKTRFGNQNLSKSGLI